MTKKNEDSSDLIKIYTSISALSTQMELGQRNVEKLWQSLEATNDKIDKIPEKINDMIRTHSNDCIARERIKKQALMSTSSTSNKQLKGVGTLLGMPKITIYLIVLIFIMVALGGVFIGMTAKNPEKIADTLVEKVTEE